jgi:hypothetical protein
MNGHVLGNLSDELARQRILTSQEAAQFISLSLRSFRRATHPANCQHQFGSQTGALGGAYLICFFGWNLASSPTKSRRVSDERVNQDNARIAWRRSHQAPAGPIQLDRAARRKLGRKRWGGRWLKK